MQSCKKKLMKKSFVKLTHNEVDDLD